MNMMSATFHWSDAAIRLALAIAAGASIGLNRRETGKAAGMCTTLLVCLAACLAMLQVNVLLGQAGKSPDSFIELDLMRLPLGILSGVGFIGAGVILRRDGLVTGVTTAATLWYVTVIGLCFGGGQLALGVSGWLLGLVVLWGVKSLEKKIPRKHSATLTLKYERSGDSRSQAVSRLKELRCALRTISIYMSVGQDTCEESFHVSWSASQRCESTPAVESLSTISGVREVKWSLNS